MIDTNQATKHTPLTILDGGMGRELEKRGAPFRQPEWSALALMDDEAHAFVVDTHLDYLRAGTDVITINSFAITPYHLGERFYQEGEALATTAGKLAQQAMDEFITDNNLLTPSNTPLVAGCLPPLFGSYRPDLFDAVLAPQLAQPLLNAQAPYADIWLAETLSSISEATAWLTYIAQFTSTPKPIWISFTLDDSNLDDELDISVRENFMPTLRSGESVSDAVKALLKSDNEIKFGDVEAILFNCSQPEVMAAALQTAQTIISQSGHHIRLGVYANAFAPKQSDKEANTDLRSMRQDTTPDNYLAWARQWKKAGATIIGGCCGIGVEHIARLSEGLPE